MNTARNSSWTGRAPRTMQQAFNAYADNTLHPMPSSDYSAAWWAWMIVIGIVTVVLIVTTR